MSNHCRNFWARSISTAVSCQALTKLSSHSPYATSGTGILSWTPAMQIAFDNAKSLLPSAVPLHHPHSCAKLSLATDASDAHIGAVLQKLKQSIWQPLAFFSKKLSMPEMLYCTFDRELIAAFSAIKHFRFFSLKVVL
jgi:hypothetical protein